LAHRCNVKFVTALSLSGEKRQAQRHRWRLRDAGEGA